METKITLICDVCQESFPRPLSWEKNAKKRKDKGRFCSSKCLGIHNSPLRRKGKEVACKNCSANIYKSLAALRKCSNAFCSKTCAATYNNTHKTHGTRRSKLEVYLEEQLRVKHPDLEIHFNQKDAINSELDIYIPSLKLAFELNGIYHYEPIHGPEKLASVQNNDQRKFQACLEKGIELCIIDTSTLVKFKQERANKFLAIIGQIIGQKISD